MNEIFEKMNGEWDWFEDGAFIPYSDKTLKPLKGKNFSIDEGKLFPDEYYHGGYSLADLLANKSWCSAVWGSERGEGGNLYYREADMTIELGFNYEIMSLLTFQMLHQDGEEQAIKYIKKTMI